jgi:hypothetical protein
MKRVYVGLVLTLGVFNLFSFSQDQKSDNCKEIASRSIASLNTGHCMGASTQSQALSLDEALDDKIKVVRAVSSTNPFSFGTEVTNCANPVQRAFDYQNGQLVPAAINGSAVYATYLGTDQQTGDTAMIRDHGNNNLQLILTLCRTGDASVDNMLQGSTPVIQNALNADLNVPNKALCPGRINAGHVIFGYVANEQHGQIPVASRFQPPAECM